MGWVRDAWQRSLWGGVREEENETKEPTTASEPSLLSKSSLFKKKNGRWRGRVRIVHKLTLTLTFPSTCTTKCIRISSFPVISTFNARQHPRPHPHPDACPHPNEEESGHAQMDAYRHPSASRHSSRDRGGPARGSRRGTRGKAEDRYGEGSKGRDILTYLYQYQNPHPYSYQVQNNCKSTFTSDFHMFAFKHLRIQMQLYAHGPTRRS